MDPTVPSLLQAALAALVRHGLTTLGTVLVGYGALGTDQQSSFVTIGSGLVVWLGSYGLSVYQKKGVIGILKDFSMMKRNLSYVSPVPRDLPHADSINAAIAVAQKDK